MKNLLLSLMILALSTPARSHALDALFQGQRGCYWLRPDYEREREAYEKKRDAEYQEVRVLDIAGVRPGMIVGEVGAGNGYFSLKLARRVGPSGKVYANDIVEDFLAEIRDRSKQQNLLNIETILGTETDPRLPAGRLDMVFMVRVLHDLTKPGQVLEKIAAGLKPGAKVIIVETEDNELDGKRSLQTRQQFMDVVARTPFVVERIDKSLPNPRSVVFILAPK
jgi:ubiquinone/menaquinone biosynthesis C-methylase UbiE